MKIDVRLNGRNVSLFAKDGNERLRRLLYDYGLSSVRDSDDGEGFAGSDIILFDGKPMYSNLIPASRASGHEITTAEYLFENGKSSDVAEAMVKAGVVQSAYNAPAMCLLLTHLLEKNPEPSKEDIKDALSGIFIRDAGYEHYYLAVKLVIEKRKYGEYKSEVSPSFREKLKVVGKPTGKIDGEALVKGERVFVEDKVLPGSLVMKVLRSPYASAYVEKIDTSRAEALDGVYAVYTWKNVPDVYYMQAGQGYPEPSPYDRKLINRKVCHVGDRVCAVVATDEKTCDEALSLVDVEYTPLDAVFTVDEAMAEGAPVVHNGKVEYVSGAPADLASYNEGADERDGKVIYQFPLGADAHKNIAASAHGGIGDLEEGLISADEFRSRILAGSAPGCTAEDVDEAVFALLVGVRPYKFALLTELAKSYDLYLLSNTNPISMIKCYRLFEEAGYPMDMMFRKLFLSYQMKMQKPSERIFRTAVEKTGCTPDRVLFIDDSAANVEGAEKAGLNAMLFNQKDNLETALKMKLEELGQC